MNENESYDQLLIAAVQGLLANSAVVTSLPLGGALQTNIVTAAQAIAAAVSVVNEA